MAPPDLGLESETWMPLFWLCNSQGQGEVYRTFSVTVNVAGRLHVSYWVQKFWVFFVCFLMAQHERANKH